VIRLASFLVFCFFVPCTSFGALVQIAKYTLNGSYAPSGVATGFTAPTGANQGFWTIAAGGTVITNGTLSTSVDPTSYFRMASFRNTALEPFRIERVDFLVKAVQGSGKLVLSSDVSGFTDFSKSVNVSSAGYGVLGINLYQDAVAGFAPSNTPGTSMGLRVYSSSSSSTISFQAQIDEITVYGKVVPEPASFAVFGMVMGGALLRVRILRKEPR
jgi:hypothetical protein